MSSSIPQTSGIYKIVCLPTGKVYVGSAVNLNKRWAGHCSLFRNAKHPNRYLQHAWNKHGEASFKFEVIELILAPFLLEREQFWIDKLRCCDPRKGFNILPKAGSHYGAKRTAESRERIRAARIATPISEFDRRSRSETRKRQWQDPVYRKRQSDSMSHSWIVIDPAGRELVVDHLASFCVENNLIHRYMRAVAYGSQHQHRGWKCRKVSDKED